MSLLPEFCMVYSVIVIDALASCTPPIVGEVVLPAIGVLIVLGHATVGFGSGLGMFRGTSLGKFLYYGSANSLAQWSGRTAHRQHYLGIASV